MSNSFGEPWIVKLADGTEVKFPLLKMRQLATLQGVISAERSEIARRLANEQKLPPAEAAKLRAMMEREEINIYSVQNWARTPVGALRILQESVGGTPAESQATIDQLPTPETAVEAALRVTGWVPEATKTCEHCANMVLVAAKKCPFCHEALTPPAASNPPPAVA